MILEPPSAIAAFLCLVLVAAPVSAAPEKIGPAQLVADAQTAVAGVARLFRERKLKLDDPALHPLLLSLRDADRALLRIEKLRAARSTTYFVSLSEARAAVSAVALSFRKAGLRSAELEAALDGLATSVHHLHRSYAWEELRRRRRGNLSETERSDLRAMNERRSSAISKIGILRDKLRSVEGGAKIVRGLNGLIALAREVQIERSNLDAWFSFRVSLDPLFGRWEVLSYYSDRGLKLDWTFIDSDMRALRSLYHSSLRGTQIDNWEFFDREIDRPEGYVSPASIGEGEKAELLRFLANLQFDKEREAAFALYEAWDREGTEEAIPGESLDETEDAYAGSDYGDGDGTSSAEPETQWPEDIPSGEGLESAGDGSSDIDDDTESSALVTPMPLEDRAPEPEW